MRIEVMKLSSPQHADRFAALRSAPAPIAGTASACRWPQPAADEPTRPDIAWDLISRADAADRRWALGPWVTVDGRTLSPYDFVVSSNTQVLRRIAGTYGWPSLSLVGQTGSEAALRLALRVSGSDCSFLRTLLRFITTAAEHGEATWAQWAHLQDRISVLDDRPQQFGTQYRLDASPLEPELHPVTAPEQLDERRLSVGLPPLHATALTPDSPYPKACSCPPSSGTSCVSSSWCSPP